MGQAFAAIMGGLKDVIFGRLTLFALLNLAIALTLTISAAGLMIGLVTPLIPEGAGWLGYVSTAGEFAASIVLFALAVALSPAVSMIVGGVLFDFAAERVEKAIGAPPARTVPLGEGVLNGLRIALPALAFNLLALPLYLIPGINALTFYALNGFLMGREYFTITAARRMPYAEAKALRKRNGAGVFFIGLACSAVPFFAPLVGASAMTRLVNALSRR